MHLIWNLTLHKYSSEATWLVSVSLNSIETHIMLYVHGMQLVCKYILSILGWKFIPYNHTSAI